MHTPDRSPPPVDPLTGLPSRERFEAYLRLQLAQAQEEQRPLALLAIDVDHLEQINDFRGYVAGDAALRLVSDVLHKGCRSRDLAAHSRGGEFVMLTTGSRVRAVVLAEHLRDHLNRSAPAQLWWSPAVTLSIGIADVAGGEAATPTELLEAAGGALVLAKLAGGDCAVTAQRTTPVSAYGKLIAEGWRGSDHSFGIHRP